MTNSTCFLLFQQIRHDSILGIQVSVNVLFTDIMEEIKIKVFNLTFLQLFFKDFLNLSHIGEVVAGEF